MGSSFSDRGVGVGGVKLGVAEGFDIDMCLVNDGR
jgi:phage shock protein PspC (stress-responsive transcriptional regulator)